MGCSRVCVGPASAKVPNALAREWPWCSGGLVGVASWFLWPQNATSLGSDRHLAVVAFRPLCLVCARLRRVRNCHAAWDCAGRDTLYKKGKECITSGPWGARRLRSTGSLLFCPPLPSLPISPRSKKEARPLSRADSRIFGGPRQGSTGIRTRIAGFRVLSANRYTMEPFAGQPTRPSEAGHGLTIFLGICTNHPDWHAIAVRREFFGS